MSLGRLPMPDLHSQIGARDCCMAGLVQSTAKFLQRCICLQDCSLCEARTAGLCQSKDLCAVFNALPYDHHPQAASPIDGCLCLVMRGVLLGTLRVCRQLRQAAGKAAGKAQPLCQGLH